MLLKKTLGNMLATSQHIYQTKNYIKIKFDSSKVMNNGQNLFISEQGIVIAFL